MKDSLLVTLADENYLSQAKQLFSGAYWNAGWKGDYMLLAHDIPEAKLKWFRKKGILIYKCRPLFSGTVGLTKKIPPTFSKFYLLKPYFKKWKNIVYLDADIIIRASIDKLAQVHGFWAAKDPMFNLRNNFFENTDDGQTPALFRQLEKNYDLDSASFNAGVLAFSTKIIQKDSFEKIVEMLEKYKHVHRWGDQPTWNLFFYRKWKKMSGKYNIIVVFFKNGGVKFIDGLVLHFLSEKPWEETHPFYREWKNSFDKADSIDLKKLQEPEKINKLLSFAKYAFYLKILSCYCNIHTSCGRIAGKIGIFLKKNLPGFYCLLKKIKR